MSIKKDCIIMSDKWGPYQTIEQCLDRIARMQTDSLRVLPEYELENSQCRTEKGKLMEPENIQTVVVGHKAVRPQSTS